MWFHHPSQALPLTATVPRLPNGMERKAGRAYRSVLDLVVAACTAALAGAMSVVPPDLTFSSSRRRRNGLLPQGQPRPRLPTGVATWSADEDRAIDEDRDGLRWKAIAAKLQGRSDSSCRNRWLRQRQRELAALGTECKTAGQIFAEWRRLHPPPLCK
ncbi:hypothetical protein EMIHUDRAFT_220085 [Emiliania huxleyi CCMP1516]|uniref:Myb-like domain-containing protein n=2 Tax=Emiliania huxleyi TaxID=2903 RepID=A0A0D3I2Z4_EMIH1|nr:hypothetical protein EMIHUDRAFT_220085 [Emiliania huxleyi CCMP1516]EOD05629.1 hypothetical protein EMIHUDRAFT_220085 [Emiliania huxleyi CCMP1516]|eukprot:XP_005758058.1 hypothetical protein EMIHUDRAFT_220085 [Emiliania huxleyi CCMP1516]